MASRLRRGKDVKKSSYYVWYLGARETEGVDAMQKALAYLLGREKLQEPFKVTLQVSNKGLKIIHTVHPGMSTKSVAVKHFVPGHGVLAAMQREDVVAASLLVPNPATSNHVHVHAYRCDSVETAELLGGQLKVLASQSDNPSKANGLDRVRSNLGSDGRSTRESESSEGSGEHHRLVPVLPAPKLYESLAAELRAKLTRGNSADNDGGPILLPPRDYDTVHRHRGNLTGIENRRCLNQTIVGGNTAIERGGTRSAASSGIGSDSAATPPPYQPHHPLGPRPSRPSRDSSSDEDWGGAIEEHDYLPEPSANMALPRVTRSPERPAGLARGVSPNNRTRRAPELRQRSPSPHYQPKVDPHEITSPRERFQDAKEMFKAMERENPARPVIGRSREQSESHGMHKLVEQSRQLHEERTTRHILSSTASPASAHHDHMLRRSHPDMMERDKERDYRSKQRVRTNYPTDHPSDLELSKVAARPRSFYDNSTSSRDPRHVMEHREVRESRDNRLTREIREKPRLRPMAYQDIPKHDRYMERDSTAIRQSLEILPTPGRYRHSYAEPPRLGLAALDPY